MKLTRILLLLGIICFAAEYALNLGTPQTTGGGVFGRWMSSHEDASVKRPDNSTEIEPNADSGTSGTARTPASKPPSSALNNPGEDFDFSSYLKNGRVTIVYFYADWCPACREMSPLLAAMNREDPEMQVVFLDIAEWNSPIADRYGVSYVPYLRIYDPRGSLALEGRAASNWVLEPMTRRPIR